MYQAATEHKNRRTDAGHKITEEFFPELPKHNCACAYYVSMTDTSLSQVPQYVLQAWKAFYAARWQPSKPQLSSRGEQPLTWQAHYGHKMRLQDHVRGPAARPQFHVHW